MSEAHKPVGAIFDAAIELPPERREAYLREACAGDEALRQRVEALLRAHGSAENFMDKPAAAMPATFKVNIPVNPDDNAVGQTIGRYKLLQEIGAGGFGVVYLAEQEEPVRRRVALKIIKMGMDTKEVIARFEAERQALALMDHPHIAKVLDAGATAAGRPYFVMELVKGERITEYCDKNNLTTRQRLDLFVQICHAVQHAHQKGIIHRDIKPSNILVAMQDGAPVPKVIDFGIAKATGQRLADKSFFTALGDFVGTPAYMSPEQAEMTSLDIDTRSDIYSLGVLLYELLTGKTPFDAKELLARGIEAMRRAIREEEPRRPSTRLTTMDKGELTTTAKRRQTDAPKLVHQVQGDLDWIAMKCLEKDRTRRYDTANGLALDLQRHINNEPVLARPPSNAYRFQKMVRRNKLACVAAAAVVLALLLGVVISSWQAGRARQAERREGALREKAQAAAQVATNALQQAQAAEKTARSEAKRAEEAATELRMNMAASDFSMALRLIAEDHWSDALSYLATSISLNPTNEAATTRLATLLAFQFWWVPMLTIKGYAMESAEFSPDGTRIVTASSDGTARVWDAQSGQPIAGPLQHSATVNSAHFSPDGKRIVTASRDNSVRVWDARSGQALTEPLQLASPDVKRSGTFSFDTGVVSAQFSPDGKQIVTTCLDHTARLWDAQSGQPLSEPMKHDSWVMSAQFSPDGRRIVTASGEPYGSAGGAARVWDTQSAQSLGEPLKHGLIMRSAQFSPDGKRIVTAADQTGQIWDAQSGQHLAGPLQHEQNVSSARFNPDGKWIVTASADHTARVWDAQSGQPLSEPMKHDSWVRSAQFSPDQKRIITASFDGTARVWSAQGGQQVAEPLNHGDIVSSAQFSPDGKRIVTASHDGTARIWDAQSGQPLIGPLQHGSGVVSAQFSSEGKRIVTASWDHTARVWDAQSGQALTGPLQHSNIVNSAQFSPDGKRIVTASDDGTARVWDAQSGQPLSGPLLHSGPVKSAQFSQDGKLILTQSAARRREGQSIAQIWDAQSGQLLAEPLKNSDSVVRSAQFSPDGKRLVTAVGQSARVWDALNGLPLTEPLINSDSVQSAQFSPDGKRIVTACYDGISRVWDAQSGLPLTEPLKHDGNMRSAQFSPDGKRIATASDDGTARVWDARSGQPLTGPLKHGGIVNSAQFSPDGKRIVTASWDHTARVWDVAPSPASYPVWLPDLAEAISGVKLNKQGLLEPTRLDRAKTINQLRQRLNEQPDDDEWVQWGRWLLADPVTRTISPFSTMTLPAYIENRIKEDTTVSLAEAERLTSGEAELSERIAQARSTLEQTARAAKLTEEADALVNQGKLVEAETKYREAVQWHLAAINPGDVQALNNLAWKLATSAAAELRCGTNAVRLAEKAVAATQRKNGGFLDTLAAAYAETRQFDKAVATQQEAIGLLQSEPEKKDYASRLKLYQENNPCREPETPGLPNRK